MPRVKLVYQEDGEWERAKAQPWTCSHPKERLRWDGSFSFPYALYCRDCGARYLNPYYYFPPSEEAQREAKELLNDLE